MKVPADAGLYVAPLFLMASEMKNPGRSRGRILEKTSLLR
jgi:hypothetical protein